MSEGHAEEIADTDRRKILIFYVLRYPDASIVSDFMYSRHWWLLDSPAAGADPAVLT